MIVVDTNAIVHLLLGGARTAEIRRVFRNEPEWAAPFLWRSEFPNVLATFMRTGTLTLPPHRAANSLAATARD